MTRRICIYLAYCLYSAFMRLQKLLHSILFSHQSSVYSFLQPLNPTENRFDQFHSLSLADENEDFPNDSTAFCFIWHNCESIARAFVHFSQTFFRMLDAAIMHFFSNYLHNFLGRKLRSLHKLYCFYTFDR